MSARSPLLVTIAGPDKPGITASVTRVLSEHGVGLRDVEQVVVHGQLIMGYLLDVSAVDDAPLLKDLLFTAKQLGLELDYSVLDARTRTADGQLRRIAVTVIADPVQSMHIQQVADVLVEMNASIRAIEQLSSGGLTALEMRVDLPGGDAELALVRHRLLELGLEQEIDLAVQREGLLRRTLRLAVMDMDSTLIPVEVIDELARMHGVAEQVQRMTADAMAGELDYTESLRRRVALLEGLDVAKVDALVDNLPLTPGAERLVGVLKRLGFKTAVISGGFDVAANRVKQRLGLDHAHSNRLEIVDGKLTGRVVPPLVTPQRKVDLLEGIALLEGIPLEQTLAIGDGANDLLMIERAGLGIAFHGKTSLRKAADTTVSRGGLDRVLYLLGVRASEVGGLA